MKLNGKQFILGFFVATAFMDAIMAVLVKIKFPVFNEANPIYIYTGSLTLLFVIKFTIVILFFLLFNRPKWYFFFKSDIVRYAWAVLLIISIMGQFNGFVSGAKAHRMEVEDVVEIPDEVKLEAYKQTNYSGNYNPTKGNPIADFGYLFAFMLVTFATHKVMEHHNYKEVKNGKGINRKVKTY